MCVWLAVELWQGEIDSFGWLVAVVFLLLMSAASSCWDLLKAIGEQHETAETATLFPQHASSALAPVHGTFVDLQIEIARRQ